MYDYPYYRANYYYPSQKNAASIEVLGEGAVSAAPNQVEIVLGAVTEGTNLQAVQTDNANILTNIINSFLKLNIPREKIQTRDFRIEAEYDYQDGKQIFRGYRVTHLLQITTDRVGETGLLVDTAVSQGANSVTGIRFTIAKPEIYENQALSLAIQNARRKAQTIANTLGRPLPAHPSQVEELPRAHEPIPFTASILAEKAVTPIEPGQLTVYAAVRVRY
ncbi:SIMPL domain-containing protein [Paenibacillus sp. sptzw28]|uniref:SIMPL domain-containing protein n=1 Tax=Paenibacillus sp. sptzw28 TaxID=715179 RepID=UPI001C6DDA5F|nr:SIMPL domain-containing protein [Paenibacillus sp. sptzw28]QYR22487.1 SIMPL domain-containing protein [Paenibacillus sp. sptzw28]